VISLSNLEAYSTFEIFKNQSFKITIDPAKVKKEFKKDHVMTVNVLLTDSNKQTASYEIDMKMVLEEDFKNSTTENKTSSDS